MRSMEQIRDAVRSFCPSGGEDTVSNAQLYEALDMLADEPEKARLRRRLNEMVRRGEVVRVEPGVYRYNWKAQPDRGVSYGRIWRAVRIKKPGWSFADIAQVTRVSYSMVLRYCQWLQEEGYVERHGKRKQTLLYRTTNKAVLTPETPYPPLRTQDPFAKEKGAAAKLVRAMLCQDPYSGKTRRDVLEACRVLMERFGKQTDNGGDA